MAISVVSRGRFKLRDVSVRPVGDAVERRRWDALMSEFHYLPFKGLFGQSRKRSVKSVYLYELAGDWRERLGVGFADAAPSLAPGEGLDGDVWAAHEFGGAELGDKRLSTRLVRSAALLASVPGRAVTGNLGHDRAAVKGYYRFIDHAADSAVTPAAILAPHRARTVGRMRGQDTVLRIQDGTDLNFATRPNCEGLGIIGRNQTAAETLGLHPHLTLAVNGEGLPLGVLRCGFDAPPAAGENAAGDDVAGKTRPWLDGLDDIAGATAELSRKTRVVGVMDREADCFELFDRRRQLDRVEVLVRAKHDRRLGPDGPKLFAVMRAGAAGGHVEIEIDRLSEREKSSRKPARPKRTGRLARADVRHKKLTLPATVPGADPMPVSAVHVVETSPPEGEKAVEWLLLTRLEVNDIDAAAEVVGFYLRRWRVEELFRVLKSGCRAEHLAFRTADRLQRAIAINTVIAWRLMAMTLLGRDVPECDAELMFTDIELRFLRDYADDIGRSPPPILGAAVPLVAILGGYQNRKHDPPPGNQLMWRGYERISTATLGYRMAERRRERSGVVQNE